MTQVTTFSFRVTGDLSETQINAAKLLMYDCLVHGQTRLLERSERDLMKKVTDGMGLEAGKLYAVVKHE